MKNKKTKNPEEFTEIVYWVSAMFSRTPAEPNKEKQITLKIDVLPVNVKRHKNYYERLEGTTRLKFEEFEKINFTNIHGTPNAWMWSQEKDIEETKAKVIAKIKSITQKNLDHAAQINDIALQYPDA